MTLNIAEIATLGSQIAELGVKLISLREKRDALNAEIQGLESQLLPLVTEHSKLVAAIAGVTVAPPVMPVPTAPPGGQPLPVNLVPEPSAYHQQMKARIRADLPKMQGLAAQEIADRLRVDSALVREVLREEFDKRNRRQTPGQLEEVPDGQ